MDLQKILSSSCRRRVLKMLSKNKTNIMQLVHYVNSSYNEVDRNIRILESEGVVISRHIGHNRILALNHENDKTITLLKAIELLDSLVQ